MNNIMNSKPKVIILCGGMGTRLKEETEFKPKPMVIIGDKPLLWHVMKIYACQGYRDFILALGYKGNHIKDYFLRQKYYSSDFHLDTREGKVKDFLCNDIDRDDFKITFAETGLETAHGERILRLKKYIPDDLFMVTYGDGVANIDINKLIEFHKKKNKIATITGVHPTSRWGWAKVDDNDSITRFDQKPSLYDYVNGGFMVFDRKFFDFLKPGDMIEDGLARLVPEKELALYKHDGFWYGMDTYRDFLLLNKLWKEDPKWKIWK